MKFNEFVNESKSIALPEVVVIKDYDGAFKSIVDQQLIITKTKLCQW